MTTPDIDCPACQHNREHGWWGNTIPSGGTHCRHRHATWTGTAPAHCTVCHRTFKSNSAADEAGCPQCKSDDDLRAMGMEPNQKGHWRIPMPAQVAAIKSIRDRHATETPAVVSDAPGHRSSQDTRSVVLLDSGSSSGQLPFAVVVGGDQQ